MALPLILWLALGCADPAEETADSAARTGDTDTGVPFPEATWSADEAVASVGQMATLGMPEPFAIAGRFSQLLEWAAGGPAPPCPIIASDDDQHITSVWGGECEFDQGVVRGDWLYEQTTNAPGNPRMRVVSALVSVNGSWVSGSEFEIGGGFQISATQQADYSWAVSGGVSGVISDPDASGWLTEKIDVGLSYEGTYGGGVWAGTLDGGLSREGGLHLYFDALAFDGASCGSSPVGVLEIRDPGTGWWVLTWPDDCSGCASLEYGGQDMGSTCEETGLYAAIAAAVALVDEE